MTVVVYRDGVMAGDRLVTRGGYRVGYTTKVFRTGDGSLWGCAGETASISNFTGWLLGGMEGAMPVPIDRGETSSYCVLHVDAGGVVRRLEAEGWCCAGGYGYAVIGSGLAVALGALHAGASARDAVLAAIEHTADCGGAVDEVRL